MALRYYYQVDLYGNPIPGTNVALVKKPTHFGAGQRYVEYTPLKEICCDATGITVTSIGSKIRYYVRVSEATNLPISGSMQKYKHKPPTWFWQEVIGKHQCATPYFNVTIKASLGGSTVANLIDALHLTGMEMVAFSGSTDNSGWTVDLLADGSLEINPDSANADTVTLSYTNGTCDFAFLLTVIPQD